MHVEKATQTHPNRLADQGTFARASSFGVPKLITGDTSLGSSIALSSRAQRSALQVWGGLRLVA